VKPSPSREAHGVSGEKLLEALGHNACCSDLIRMKLPTILEDNYDAHFSLKNMFKDAQIALSLANAKKIETPALSTTASLMFKTIQQGHGDEDYSVLAANYRKKRVPIMRVEGWIDLSSRAKFLLRGPDAERYLNGQTTNDVRRATPGLAMPSLITTAKGKIEADVFIARPGPDSFFIDAPDELREALQIRLDRYLIADDAEISDVTEEFGLVHVLGAEPEVPEGAVMRKANRYGIDGWDLLGGPGISLAQPGTALTPDDLEPVRIAHGIPRWGAELSADVLPQEARLEERCLDFHKGCYIGQEVISRIKSVGKGQSPALRPGGGGCGRRAGSWRSPLPGGSGGRKDHQCREKFENWVESPPSPTSNAMLPCRARCCERSALKKGFYPAWKSVKLHFVRSLTFRE